MQTIASNQASAEVPINENFALLGWAAVYGKRAEASSALTWAYEGGRWGGFAITASTLTLTNAADNYIVVAIATGVISTSTATTNWNDSTNYARVYKVTTAGGVVTATEDHRAGPGGVIVNTTITVATGGRETLTADRTYYVRTDGSNSNTGLANTAGGAFLTIQKAVDVVSGTLDLSIYNVTIRVVAGTYTGSTTLKTLIGSGKVAIRGDTADLTSTVISTTASDCFNFGSGYYGTYTLEYLKLQTTTSGSCISTIGNGVLTFQNLNFGASPENHIVLGVGTFAQATGNYTISGAAGTHAASYDGAQLRIQSLTITITGTPAFGGQFITVGRGGNILANGLTFSGTATGKRYTSGENSILFTGGAATTYFPGSVAGTTATGGLYV